MVIILVIILVISRAGLGQVMKLRNVHFICLQVVGFYMDEKPQKLELQNYNKITYVLLILFLVHRR